MATIKHRQPTLIYRYRPIVNFDCEIATIEEHYLHCSHFKDLNDPSEGFFRSGRRVREGGRRNAVREKIIGHKDSLRICSFSEVYDNHLMWAHYADKFRGICVSYSLSRLLGDLGEGVQFAQIVYREKVPAIRGTAEVGEEAMRVLSCKSNRWAYENEWRMFSQHDKTTYCKVDCVTRVYIGSRVEESKKTILIKKLKSLKISISKMKLRKYSIDFESIFESRQRW